MRSSYSLAITILAIILFSCNGSNKGTSSHFSLQIEGKKKSFQENDTLIPALKTPNSSLLSKVEYSIDGTVLPSDGKTVVLQHVKLGKQQLKASFVYDGTSESITHPIEIFAEKAPEVYTYTILKEYPHDRNAYTQGLEFLNDTLYESIGQRGKSALRKVDYRTGEILKETKLSDIYFGEGITILNNRIYQLTWEENVGFIYDLHTLEKTGQFSYQQSREGWGLCTDGTQFYKSDGTEKIWTLDANTLEEKEYIQLASNKALFSRANELEWVDGLIYANTYGKDGIMIINPKNGAIVGVIDCRGLKEKVTQHPYIDVLNGIAYHPERKTFFITGKNWDKLFEVTFHKK